VRLHHRAEVAARPADVWDLLQDTRAVDQGVLRVGIGPLKMRFTGDVAVVERDSRDRRIVLDATGRDRRGSGSVRARVRLRVSPYGPGARIEAVSDLDLTGRIASLRPGVRDVSDRMFAEFTERLTDRGSADPEPAPAYAGGPADEAKVLPLVWTVARARLADVLDRLSDRVRP